MKISIIVPVYKVESYLPQCLESIIGQSFRDLEILLIDDGSPDNCGAICDEYAARDARIRVIHQKNGGAANAKNTGLRAATGEYLSFVDADDILEPGAYELMVRELNASGADVIQCGYRDLYLNRSVDRVTLKERRVFDAESYLRRYTLDWTCGLLWDKLYRRELFDGIFFEEGHRIDDEFFTYQGIMNASKILHLPEIVYSYRQRASSVTRSPEAKRQIVLDKLDYLEKRRAKVLARFPSLKQDFDYHYLSMLVILSTDPGASEASIRLTQRMLRDYFRREKPCRMEASLRMKLLRLQYAPSARLLKGAGREAAGGHNNGELFD